MNERILCVDDEPCVLQAYQRALRKQFSIDGAAGGEEALNAIAQNGPYAVIVADMRMPGMNGIELLVKVRGIAPDTVRMMLTGYADNQTALDAVNEGHIFRFMTKPCPPEVFAKVLEAGIAQYRLITAERELLSRTLSGSIKVMTEILAMVNPAAFSRSSRVHKMVRQMCEKMRLPQSWLIEMAAMLSQIGCVAVPSKTLIKVFRGNKLEEDEEKAYLTHPQTAKELLECIPRLEKVVEVIVRQNDLYKDVGDCALSPDVADIVLGGNILKIAIDWDTLVTCGTSDEDAMTQINNRKGWYHPGVLTALREVMKSSDVHAVRNVHVKELFDGAVLADNVRSISGTLLCAKGQEITPALRVMLRNYYVNVGIQMPIKIIEPYECEGIAMQVLSSISATDSVI
jgi:response regulator RpfG family c-di-GMP phosphodiesterase